MRRCSLPPGLLPLAAAALLMAGCHHASTTTPQPKAEDPIVVFARTTFEALAKGDPAVRDKLAWDRFNDKGRDVGKEWRATAAGAPRQAFEQDFLTAFAAPYKFYPKGAHLIGWRLLSRSHGRSVVQADLGPTKIYFFVIDTWRHHRFAGWSMSADDPVGVK